MTARVRVDDLGAASTFYERLTGAMANRFEFGEAEPGRRRPVLALPGTGEAGDRLGRVVATVSVDDLAQECARLTELGATVVSSPMPTPNGRRVIVRHPDGAVVEYVGP